MLREIWELKLLCKQVHPDHDEYLHYYGVLPIYLAQFTIFFFSSVFIPEPHLCHPFDDTLT